MNRQQRIDRFLPQAHRLALHRLRQTPGRIEAVQEQLARWPLTAIADEKSFVVIGSQAVLLLCADAPPALWVSREVDFGPALHRERADLIDGAIGALSSVDETFGYHADGAGPETAVRPDDWMSRSRCITSASHGDLSRDP